MTDTTEQRIAALEASNKELRIAADEYFQAVRGYLACEHRLVCAVTDARRLHEPSQGESDG